MIAKVTDIVAVATLSEREAVEVAIVALDDSGEHALALISNIVGESACPVIVVLHVEDPAFVRQAAKRGVFAYLTDGDASDDQFESAIDVVLHRFAEYLDLQGAFGRRAVTECAKGILMERHQIGEEAAFNMLRDGSRKGSRKLVDVAHAVLDAHALLPSARGDTRPLEPSPNDAGS